MTQIFIIVAIVVVGIPAIFYLFGFVHAALDRLCVRHAERYCKKHRLEVRRIRLRPEFDPTGIKTESTQVQLDCLDTQQQRRLVLLLVWPFGLRKLVSDEPYPESYESEWPESAV